jgi:hypothetical protein
MSVRAKKLVVIISATVSTVFALVKMVRDFIASDGLHYFSEQPYRLLLVTVIGIAGGITTLFFDRLTPGWRWRVKLFVLGLAAVFMTSVCGWLVYVFFSLGVHPVMLVFSPVTILMVLLWFRFYQVFRSRVDDSVDSASKQ